MLEVKFDVPEAPLSSCIFVLGLSLFFFIPGILMFFVLLADNQLFSQEIIFPVMFLFIPSVITTVFFVIRNNGLKKIYSSLNLIKVVFDDSRAKFFFTKEECNFECHCEQIKDLELVLNTSMHRSKNGSYPALDSFTLKFNVLNKLFNINCAPFKKEKFIYKLIENTKDVGNFHYSINGPQMEKYNEKIDIFMQYGVKPVLTNDEESWIKLFSILSFIFVLCSFFSMKINVNAIMQNWQTYAPYLFFIGVTFFFDVMLIFDKIHERIWLRENHEILSCYNSTKDNDYSVESTKFWTPFIFVAVKLAVLYFIYYKF